MFVGPHAVGALPLEPLLELAHPLGQRGAAGRQGGTQAVEFRPPIGDCHLAARDPFLLPHDLLEERQRPEEVLPAGLRRRLGLGDQRPDPGQALVGLGRVVGEIRPGTLGVGRGHLLEGLDGLVAAGGKRLEPGHAPREQFVDAGLGGDDALEHGQCLGGTALGEFDVLDRTLEFTRVEQLGRQPNLLPRLVDECLWIGAGLRQQPALGPLGLDLLLRIGGRLRRPAASIIRRLEGVDPPECAPERRRRLLEPASRLDGIGLERLPCDRKIAGDVGDGGLEDGGRAAAGCELFEPAAGRAERDIEFVGQCAGRLVCLLQHVERGPAFPGHVGQRRPRVGRVEQSDRGLGLGRAQEPLGVDPAFGPLPDVHEPQPTFAIAADRGLHRVVGRAGRPLHRRLEVGVGVRQQAVPLLLTVEQVGKRDHLPLEGGEFCAGLVQAAVVPGTLDEKHRQPTEHPRGHEPDGQRAGAEDAGRLDPRLVTVGPVLHPGLGGGHEV